MEYMNTISLFCRNFLYRKVDLPIRSSDMGLLIFISKNTKVTSSDATQFFNVSKPMIAAMVKRLVSKEYLVREAHEYDMRKQYLVVTQLGRELVNDSKLAYIKFEKDLKRVMGEDEYMKLVTQIKLANTAIRSMT